MEDREKRHNSLLPIKRSIFLINVAFEKCFDLSSTVKLMLKKPPNIISLGKKSRGGGGQKANRHFQRTHVSLRTKHKASKAPLKSIE